jgi:hypothetical protein
VRNESNEKIVRTSPVKILGTNNESRALFPATNSIKAREIDVDHHSPDIPTTYRHLIPSGASVSVFMRDGALGEQPQGFFFCHVFNIVGRNE